MLLKKNVLQTVAWIYAQQTLISFDRLPSSENA